MAEEPLTGLLHWGVNANQDVCDRPVAPPPLPSEIKLNFTLLDLAFFPPTLHELESLSSACNELAR